MYKNKNYLILSSVDWDTHKQLHHALTKHLINSGGKVLFVENTGTRSIRLADIARVKQRLRNLLKSKSGFTVKNKKLTIFTPLFIPFHFNYFIKKINNLIVIGRISKWIELNKFSNPIIINFLPNPITEGVLNSINNSAKIYFMADNMTINSPKKDEMEKFEKNIINNSDFIFYTSDLLKNKFKKISKKNQILSSGVDYKKYNVKKKINNKFVIGYIGAIREILDERLILEISKNLPNCEIRLVGPELVNFKSLKMQKNIKFFGQINHNKIPETLSKFDIGIIPYKINLFTNSIYPLKLNEYLAAGLPVISTKIKTISEFNKSNPNVIKIIEDKKSFIDTVNKIRSKKIIFKTNKLRSIAKLNSWDKKFESFDEKIDQVLFENRFNNLNFRESIKSLFHKKKTKYLKNLIFIIILVLIVYKL